MADKKDPEKKEKTVFVKIKQQAIVIDGERYEDGEGYEVPESVADRIGPDCEVTATLVKKPTPKPAAAK